VIVVVGNPRHRPAPAPRAGGLAVGVAATAAAAGAEVELVGKIGDDPAGEAALLDLAARHVGHVAILRDSSRPTPFAHLAASEEVFDEQEDQADDAGGDHADAGLPLEPADIELALRYLPDYRVLVVADELAPASLEAVIAAGGWSGAALVVIVRSGGSVPNLPADATVLEAPADGEGEEAFASVVGAYSAALDRGEEPSEAFASASVGTGWSPVAAD
jgi:hypothetical protein